MSKEQSATLDEAMPREVREAIVRYTASMSGILESFSDQKHVNAALIDVAQVALRCARLATSPSVGPGVEKAIAEGDYASAYGLQIDHEMSQQAETPTAFIGTRYRSGGIVDHHTVELEKWQLHDKGYQESEISPLYAAPQDIAQEAAASVPSEIAPRHALCATGCDLMHPKESTTEEANSLRAREGGCEPVTQTIAALNSHSTASSTISARQSEDERIQGWAEDLAEGKPFKPFRETIPSATPCSGWVQTSERVPEVKLGDEEQFWVCAQRKHNGKRYVFPLYYVNKPAKDAQGEPTEWAVESSYGDDDCDAVGWFHIGPSEAYDEFYQSADDDKEVIAWTPMVKPEAPK